ncbi:MAG: hypothetical protein ACRC7N_16395, partial [Clostridium sp.]
KYLFDIEPGREISVKYNCDSNNDKIRSYICLYDKDYNMISIIGMGGNLGYSVNIITPTLSKYIGFRIGGSDITTVNFKNIICEYTTNQQTPYQPYQSDTETILLSEPLRSLPNGKCDELINNKITRIVGKAIYDNTKEETVLPYAAQPKDTNFMLFISKYASDANKDPRTGKVYCDRFAEVGYYAAVNAIPGYEGVYSEYTGPTACMYFFISKSKLSTPDINGFKAWLKANPTTVYYELETPTIEQLQPIDLKSYNGGTYISTTNNIKGEVTATVPVK